MSAHANVDSIRDGFDAFTKGDPASLEDLLGEDVVWHAPGHNRWSGDFSGKRATMDRMYEMAREGIVWNFVVHDMTGSDDHVVALTDATLTKGDVALHGKEVQVLHVLGGKVIEFWGYNEDQAAVDALLDS